MSNQEQELSRLEAWFVKNQEKAMTLIEKHIEPGEEVKTFASAMCYPPEILTWIPIIGTIIEARKKRYLLAVTKTKFIAIRSRLFRFEELSAVVTPIDAIRETEVTKFPFFCNLRVVLNSGKNHLFKELPFPWAAGLKDAIDEAQGKASTFD